MDVNVVVISGRLAATPEVRSFESGARLIRYLVTTRSEAPRRRIDVVPVTLWNPDDDLIVEAAVGQSVWIAGSVQRRFWAAAEGRRSRLEVVAQSVELHGPDVPEEPG
jgi:single-stranded DNA-binding protein